MYVYGIIYNDNIKDNIKDWRQDNEKASLVIILFRDFVYNSRNLGDYKWKNKINSDRIKIYSHHSKDNSFNNGFSKLLHYWLKNSVLKKIVSLYF